MLYVYVCFLICIVGTTATIIIERKALRKNRMDFSNIFAKAKLPIIGLYNSGSIHYFIVDTGAGHSIINKDALSEFLYRRTGVAGRAFGAEGNPVDTEFVEISLYDKSSVFTENFHVMDMHSALSRVKEQYGVEVVGLLGNTFLHKYKYCIDYSSLTIYRKKRL